MVAVFLELKSTMANFSFFANAGYQLLIKIIK